MNKKILVSCILFFIVMSVFYFSPTVLWFREDDLGTIMNGFIFSFDDFVHAFSMDDRSCICPINYQRSLANVISGFWRPFQHLVFTMIYGLFGMNPWAFYGFHCAIHAINSTLFFLVCSSVLPIVPSMLAGLFFAFFNDMSWLTWIATMQINLMVMFLLLMILALKRYIVTTKNVWWWVAGVLYFFSLLCREGGILLPLWLFLCAFLLYTKNSDTYAVRFCNALRLTWVFFVANVVYVLCRLWAFGIGSLPRTLYNMSLRFTGVSMQSHCAIFGSCRAWLESLCNMGARTTGLLGMLLIIILVLSGVVCMAYRNKKLVLVCLLCGLTLASWPGFLIYPSARYIYLVYPFLFFIVISAGYSFITEHKKYRAFGVLVFFMIGYSAYKNTRLLNACARSCCQSKKCYDDFFSRYSIHGESHFLLIGSPLVSDIQNIFQWYTGSLKTTVAHEPYALFAQEGIMACRGDYRISGVSSDIAATEKGFRFVSHDKRCGWWLRFSDHPLAFDIKDRAFKWMAHEFEAGRIYPCAVGTFTINKLYAQNVVAEAFIQVDKQWRAPGTFVVVWDSNIGAYKILMSYI